MFEGLKMALCSHTWEEFTDKKGIKWRVCEKCGKKQFLMKTFVWIDAPDGGK